MDTNQISDAVTSMAPMAISYGLRVLGVIVLLWIAAKIAGWSQDKVTGNLRNRKFDETLAIFFGSMLRWLIMLATVLACLSVFGIETTSFAAILGAAGLAVGLAFQGTLSNFSAGVMLLVFRPFKVGDAVNAAGEFGIVAEIGLFTTSLNTLDNRHIIIPNSSVTGGTITNVSHNEKRRVDIDVGVDYSASIDDTRAALEKAASRIAGRDAEKGHQVIVLSFGGSSVDWQVRTWCNKADYWGTYESSMREIKLALEEAGIGIPFPQMDVHFVSQLKISGEKALQNAPSA